MFLTLIIKLQIGCVTCKNSNHNGIECFYSMMAIEEGLIGITFSNAKPIVAPTRAKEAAIGSNPLCFGAPGTKNNFLLDMSTAATSFGKIAVYKDNGRSLPEGWVIDNDGKHIHDADVAFAVRYII